MVILKEIFGAVIWIVFNKSWHSIACCQKWPKGKSLLVHFLLNWKWQGMLKALLLLFVTNENFTAKFSCWRVLISLFPQPEEEEKNSMLKQNLLCHDFSIASRSFWVMIMSSACGSQSLLTKSFYRDEMKSRCFYSVFLQNWSVKNVKYGLKWHLQAESWKPWLCSHVVLQILILYHLLRSFPPLNQGCTYIPDQLTHNELLWNSLSDAMDTQFLFLFVSCAFLFFISETPVMF